MATRLGKGLLRRLRLLFCRASSSGVAGGLGSRRAGGRWPRPEKGRTGCLGPPVPPSDPPRGAPAPSGGAPRRDLQFQLEIAMSSSRLLSANRWAALDAARGAAGAAGGGGGPARGGPPPPRDPGIRRPRRTTRPGAAAKPVSPSGQPGDSLPREREAGTRTLFSRKRDGVQVRSPSAPRGRAGGPPSPDCWRLAPRARDPGPRAPARAPRADGGGGRGPSPRPGSPRPGPPTCTRASPARQQPAVAPPLLLLLLLLRLLLRLLLDGLPAAAPHLERRAGPALPTPASPPQAGRPVPSRTTTEVLTSSRRTRQGGGGAAGGGRGWPPGGGLRGGGERAEAVGAGR